LGCSRRSAAKGITMRDLTEIGLNYSGQPVTTPPPTSHQIEVVESLVGVSLPASYRAFLQFSNGGHPEFDLYEVDKGTYRYGWTINNFFHMCSDTDTTNDVGDVVWNYHHRFPGAPRELLPVARDVGGNLFCLDLTQDGKGRVIVQVHDEPGFPYIPLAASFDEFINGLKTDPEV